MTAPATAGRTCRRRSALAPFVALAAVATLLLAGCERPSTAAYVGDRGISASSLDKAVQAGLASSAAMRSAWGSRESLYRQRVLSNAVYHQLTLRAAARAAVSVSEAEVSTVTRGIDTTLFTQLGIAPADVRAFLRDVLVSGEVAVKEHAVGSSYSLGLIGVTSKAEATQVLAALNANPNSYESLVAKHQGSLPDPQNVTLQQLARLVTGPALLKLHDGSNLTVSTQQGMGVIHIFGIDRFDLTKATETQKLQASVEIYPASRSYVASVAAPRVKINPRYGQWDPATGEITTLGNSALVPRATATASASASVSAG
ncbi:MAG: hypothetical protein DLM56_00045 [Pseudonocardiales bacterium]|nr:MAG: hypothetical protein DLM56_00045 [Pseudonocardiales bacterium]